MFAGTWRSFQLPLRAAIPALSQLPLAEHTPKTVRAQRMHGGKPLGAAVATQLALSSMGAPMLTRSAPFGMPLAARQRGKPTAAAAAPDHDKQPATAAQHQQAVKILMSLGLSRITAAWILCTEPEVTDLEPGGLQARVDALWVAFGLYQYRGVTTDTRSAANAKLGRRLAACPRLLTLAVDDIRASRGHLTEFCLTIDEAAAVLAAEPRLVLRSMEQLRVSAENLQVSFRLSPQQLRALVIEMPLCLRRGHGNNGVTSEMRKKFKGLVAESYEDCDWKQLEPAVANIR
jgi:hypothetical protein